MQKKAMQKVRGGLFFKCEEPEKLAAWYKKYLGIQIDGTTNSSMFNPNEAQAGDVVKESYADFGWFIDPAGFKVELVDAQII